MRHRRPPASDEIGLRVRQVGGVRGDDIGGEQAEGVEVARATGRAARDHGPDLLLGLGHVNEHVRARAVGEPPHAAEQIGAAGVGGVRREPGPDARARRVGAEALDEALGQREVGLRRAVVERVADHRAEAARLHRRRHRVHVAVAIRDGRDAVQEQLEAARQGAGPQLVRTETPLQREQPAREPLAARHILGEAAEDPHRRMRVGVDEPREQDRASEVDDLPGRVLGRRPDGADLRPLDGDRSGSVDRRRRVEREDLIREEDEGRGIHGGSVAGFQRTTAFSSATTARKNASARNEPTAVVA